MTECDKCGCEVTHVWRHRAFDSETHRKLQWVCATCHPDLPDIVTTDARSDADTESDAEADRIAVTDGGRSAFACPSCTGPTVNGQGLFSCVDCGWSGPY